MIPGRLAADLTPSLSAMAQGVKTRALLTLCQRLLPQPGGVEPALGPFDQRLVTANRVDLLDWPILAVRVEVSEHPRVDLAALGDLTKRGVLRSHDLDVLLPHRPRSISRSMGAAGFQ